jgi:protein-arginine kinase activator protein McsA
VALAIRTGAPIYTTEEIMVNMSVVFDEGSEEQAEIKEFMSNEEKDISQLSTEKLNTLLQEALKKEDFESAISLRDELSKRKDESQ